MISVILGDKSNALSVARSLASVDCERHILSTSHSNTCKSSKFVDYYCSFQNTKNVLEALKKYDYSVKKVLYSTSDLWAAFLSAHEEELRSMGFLFLTVSQDTVDFILDKFLLYKRLNAKILMPETVLASHKQDFSGGGDFIIKPRRSFFGDAVVEKGFRASSESSSDFVMQERLSMDVRDHYSFSGVASKGEVVFGGLSAKVLEYPSPGGTATVVATKEASGRIYELIFAKAKEIISALYYEGAFEIEFILHQEKIWFLEFNPRFWLQHELFLVAGANVAKVYMDVCLENSPQVVALKEHKKTLWIHEGFWVSFFRSQCSLKNVARDFLGSNWVFAYWRFDDPKPFFYFLHEVICKKK